jgi:hypothetical protein
VTSAAIAEPRRVVANMFAKGTAFAVEKGAAARDGDRRGPRAGGRLFGRFAFASSLAVVLAFATDLGLTIWTTRAWPARVRRPCGARDGDCGCGSLPRRW